MAESKEDALSRWSRLKEESRARGESGARTDEAEDTGERAASSQEAGRVVSLPDEAAVDAAGRGEGEAAYGEGSEKGVPEDLPDIESLDYNSDYTAFMRESVPEEIRNLALRKLWRSNPLLANVDGLNDYDLDYTFSEVVQIAGESAEDLRRGSKRKSAHDLRREERDRMSGSGREQEGKRRLHADDAQVRTAEAERRAGPDESDAEDEEDVPESPAQGRKKG